MPGKKSKKQKLPFSNTTVGQLALLLTILSMGYFLLQSPKLFPPPQPSPLPDSQLHQLTWPKVYSGILPCADCSGLQTTLTLQKDGTYTLVEKYLGKDTAIDSFGTWEKVRGVPTNDQATIYKTTNSKTKTVTNYQQLAPNEISLLGSDLKQINTTLNFSLIQK